MKDIFIAHRVFVLVLVAYAIVLFTGTGRVPIFILDEAKNATCAYEMLDNKDWIVPKFNGQLRTDKPPLHYYFMSLGYTLFGKTPFAARFFSVLFGLLLLVTLYYYTLRNTDKRTALVSALILGGSLHLSLEYHLAVPDPYLIFFMSLGMLCFYDYMNHNRTREWVLMILGFALGTLAKGPVALLLPGLIGLLYMVWTGGSFLNKLRSLKPIRAILLYGLIAVPWFLAVHYQTDGAWTQGFFMDHNLGRFTNEMEGHGGFFLLPVLIALLGLLPFSWFVVKVFRSKPWLERNSLVCFAFIASVVILLFFSLSNTQLPNYILPAYPMLAIVLGSVIAYSFRPFMIFNVVMLIALVAGILFAGRIDPIFEFNSNFVQFSLIVPVGLAMAPLIVKAWKSSALYYVVGSWMALGVILFGTILPKITSSDPVQIAIEQLDLKEKNCVYFERFSPSFAFYIDEKIDPVLGEDVLASRILQRDFEYIITTDRYNNILSKYNVELVFRKKDIFESRVTEIWALKEN